MKKIDLETHEVKIDEIVSQENIKKELNNSKEIIDWIGRQLDGQQDPKLSKEEKYKYAMSAYHFVIHCAQSICILIDHEQYGAALALIRPLKDSFLRGNWLQNIATTDEFICAKEKNQFPPANKLIEDIPPELNGPQMKDALNILNDFVHIGFKQLEYRILGNNSIGNSFPRLVIVGALGIADTFGLAAICDMTKDWERKSTYEEAFKRFRELESQNKFL